MNIKISPFSRVEALPSIEQEELRGITRTVAEIHWLLLALVLLFLVFARTSSDGEINAALAAGLFIYAGFVMGFRYANFYKRESRWKIAIETWVMISFITWTVSYTGGLASPLLNTYLLPVITAALTLSKITTLIEIGLIAACYLFLGGGVSTEMFFSFEFYGGFIAQIAPVLLVGYILTMFSADIRYGLNRAKVLAEVDELTGLFNLRGLAITANRLLAQAIRYNRAATILMIDSDNLKTINDEYGHDAGNRLLKHLAMAIRNELRDNDVPARYGGDEFIVFLSETPPQGAIIVAERIRDAMASTPLDVGGGKLVTCTVSIGIASFPEDGNNIDAITARADRAMYQAKRDGRNRVVRFMAE
jgi:diguanylate cyclase (GGDEF)-like protein